MKSSQVNEMGNFWEIPPSLKNCILSQYLTVTRGHICWDIQLYNTCADHPNIHQSQKQCQLYEKVRFNSITLSLSSLTKSQQKQSYIQMSYSTIARLPTPALATMHPSGGFIPYMTLTSFNFLAGDKELRDMPVFLMVDVHGMNGSMTP